MVSIVNGARVTPPKPNIGVANVDPNARLTVLNAPKLISVEDKRETEANKQITVFTPDKLKKSTALARLQLIIVKQREGDLKEVTLRIRKQVTGFEQQLKN
jgi:replicative DNA helicase